jgi:hypothetical protein
VKTIDFILSNLQKIRYNARQLIAAVDSNRDARERNLSLQDYLKDNGLDFFFSKYFFFLVINLILTKFKKTTKQVKIDHTIIDYNKLKLSTGLSKSVLKKTVHRFQVSVSKMSCDFVLTRASNTEFHEKIITGLIRLDDDSRFVIPGHLATSILIQYSMKKESTLFKISATRILSGSIIDIVNIFYRSCSSGFEIVETNELKPRLPFIVIEGVTEYNDRVESKKSFVERLNEAGLREIVCCYMAKHDQYPGKN